MNADCIIYQSVWNAESQPVQQLSNLSLTGFSTINDSLNTDSGRLYGSFSYSATTYSLNLYSDPSRDNLVANAISTNLGIANVVAANDSGINGTVNIVQYLQNDSLIEAVCFLTTDNDVPLAELNALSDYDPVYGFANYHILAFSKVKEIVCSRNRTDLFNPKLVDAKQINGGVGGFDLSKVLSWEPLKEATGQYVLYKLAERNYIEVGGVWERRSKEAYNRFRAYMESVDLAFDLRQQRVVEKTRTLSTWKVSRA